MVEAIQIEEIPFISAWYVTILIFKINFKKIVIKLRGHGQLNTKTACLIIASYRTYEEHIYIYIRLIVSLVDIINLLNCYFRERVKVLRMTRPYLCLHGSLIIVYTWHIHARRYRCCWYVRIGQDDDSVQIP